MYHQEGLTESNFDAGFKTCAPHLYKLLFFYY